MIWLGVQLHAQTERTRDCGESQRMKPNCARTRSNEIIDITSQRADIRRCVFDFARIHSLQAAEEVEAALAVE